MNRQEYMLTCLAEECLEVAKRCTKALRFGLDEVQPGHELTNADRIQEEMIDVLTIHRMLKEEGLLPVGLLNEDLMAMETKREKVEKFMAYSREQGCLE